MKIRPDFILHQVMNFYVIIGVGDEAYTPNQIMSLNESGAALWRLLEEEDGASEKDLVNALVKEYDIDEKKAAEDVEVFLKDLRERSMILE